MPPHDALEPLFQATPPAAALRPPAWSAPAWNTRQVLLAIGACLLGLAIMYHVQISSGGTLFAGDRLDGRIAVALGEHWFNVFRGLERWNEPLYFAPVRDTLGYNDGYFLYGVAFSLFRATGLDGILSGELAGATFRVTGFVGMLLFAAGPCGFGARWAVLAALLGMVGGAGFIQAGHIQLATVGLAPVLGWLVWHTARGIRRDGTGGIPWSCAAASLMAAWLLTAFYTIWFTALFAGLMALATLSTQPKRCLAAMRQVRLLRLTPALLILAAGCTLFALVYLPKARETGMHTYRETLTFEPPFADLLHFGATNLLYGWLDTWLTQQIRPGFAELEHVVGFSPVLLGLALVAVGWAIARPHHAAWRRPVALAFAASLMLSLRVGTHSLWWFVFEAVPGAPAVRVVSRFYLLLGLVAALLATDTIRRLAPLLSRRWVWLVPGLAAVLVAGEINLGGYFDLDRRDETAFLASVPSPPPSCRAFYISHPRSVLRSYGQDWQYETLLMNIDAMVLAERFHLPTLNGHASFLPPGFGFGYHDPAQYAATSQAAIFGLGMEAQTCALSLQPPQWSTDPIHLAPLALDHTVEFGAGGESNAYTLSHWSAAEQTGRWTEGTQADLGMIIPATGAIRVEMLAAPFSVPGHPGDVALYANGTLLKTWLPPPGDQTITATIPAGVVAPTGTLRLRLTISAPARPSQFSRSIDTRQLGLFVERLRLSPAD